MTTRYHCDACGWEGEDPVLNEVQGSGCGGVLWTLRDCPECGQEVYEIHQTSAVSCRGAGAGRTT
jgi:hypothetical protein